MWNFSKKFLLICLMVFIVSSSCFALAFLPSYSTSAEEEDTGFMSLLRSMTSKKSDASSTEDGEAPAIPEAKVEDVKVDGYICYTEKEVEEMDKTLEHAEKMLKDDLKPFHFGLGVGLGTAGLIENAALIPTLDMQMRWNDWIVNGSVGYGFTVKDGFNVPFDLSRLYGHIGVMYEF